MFIKTCKPKDRLPFYQTSEIFPSGLEFEKKFSEIKHEVLNLIKTRELTTYQDIDANRAKEVSLKWKLYYVYVLGKSSNESRNNCPVIYDIVKKIPNAINATIAVLDPRVDLAPHTGPYAGILRYHLGIKVPKSNPPKIRVLNQYHTWQEGESIVIDDYYEHEVINNSEDIRVILMVDFRRPMNNFISDYINKVSLKMKAGWAKEFITKANKENI